MKCVKLHMTVLHQSPQMLKVAAVVGKTKLEMICYAFVERVFTGFEEEN